MAEGWLTYLTAIRQKSTLPGALRELVIMRVAILNGAPYEADQHAPIALKEGMTQAQLDALPAWQDSALFDDTERAVLAYTDAMTRNIQVDAPVFEAIRERFPHLYRHDATPIHRALWQAATECLVVEKVPGGEGEYVFMPLES